MTLLPQNNYYNIFEKESMIWWIKSFIIKNWKLVTNNFISNIYLFCHKKKKKIPPHGSNNNFDINSPIMKYFMTKFHLCSVWFIISNKFLVIKKMITKSHICWSASTLIHHQTSTIVTANKDFNHHRTTFLSRSSRHPYVQVSLQN